jgi:hypothetical protein
MTESLKTVSTGYKLVYVGFLLQVLAIVITIGFVIAVMAGMIPAVGLRGFLGVMYSIAGLSLFGHLIGLFGRFKCMALPHEAGSGAKQMIVFSVALELVALLTVGIYIANAFVGRLLPGEVAELLDPAATVMSIIAAALFLLFTKAVATFVRRPDLAADAGSVLSLGVVLVVVFVVHQVLVRGGAGARNPGAGIGSLAAMIFAIMFVIRYANLLLAMSAATREYATHSVYDYEDELKPAAGDRPSADADRDRDQW